MSMSMQAICDAPGFSAHYAQTVCTRPSFQACMGTRLATECAHLKQELHVIPLFIGNTQYIAFIKKRSVNVPTEGMLNYNVMLNFHYYNTDIDENKCKEVYSDREAKMWVGCDVCPRWWHLKCAKLKRTTNLRLDWQCPACRL